MKIKSTVLITFLAGAFLVDASAWGQVTAPAGLSGPGFDQIVNRVIFQENRLLNVLRDRGPVAETYIQELAPDRDFGSVPVTDHYFVGRLDLSHGVNVDSYIPAPKARSLAFDPFKELVSIKYLPRGFAQMMLIDGNGFDLAHYQFELVRREFLGEVRTWVIDVNPLARAAKGRFKGRIWVEDKDFNIVRFNGTYVPMSHSLYYMHFDSWRVNCGHLWMPFESYSEESDMPYGLIHRKLRFKALTRYWGYDAAAIRKPGEFTNVSVDLPSVQDTSSQAADTSAVESLRAWEHESEDNVLDRLEKASLLSPRGEVDKILDTVTNNLIVSNNLDIVPEVRTRVVLTMPLESFTVGHTIVISRGLLDTLPDEVSLAAILAHELAHIALGHEINTRFAFSDGVLFADDKILEKFRLARNQDQETAANEKAMEILAKSPYSDKLDRAGLYLKALGAESDHLPALIKPLFGSRMAEGNNVLRMATLIENAQQLQRTRVDQMPALPLGSRTSLNPWNDKLRMTHVHSVALLSAREKMVFEISPIHLNLKYDDGSGEQVVEETAEATAPAGAASPK